MQYYTQNFIGIWLIYLLVWTHFFFLFVLSLISTQKKICSNFSRTTFCTVGLFVCHSLEMVLANECCSMKFMPWTDACIWCGKGKSTHNNIFGMVWNEKSKSKNRQKYRFKRVRTIPDADVFDVESIVQSTHIHRCFVNGGSTQKAFNSILYSNRIFIEKKFTSLKIIQFTCRSNKVEKETRKNTHAHYHNVNRCAIYYFQWRKFPKPIDDSKNIYIMKLYQILLREKNCDKVITINNNTEP